MNKSERNQIIGTRYKTGETVEKLAKAYGISPGTVRNIVQVIGASRNAEKAERNEEIREASKTGFLIHDLVELYHLSSSRLKVIVRSVGAAPRF